MYSTCTIGHIKTNMHYWDLDCMPKDTESKAKKCEWKHCYRAVELIRLKA